MPNDFLKIIKYCEVTETVLVGRILVRWNKVACDIYFFLSFQINPPTCPFLWLWEG